MPSLRLLVVLAAALAVGLPMGAGARTEQNPVLLATVGPGFTIVLSNPDGTRVEHLDPGTYEIAVDDRSEEHNFHLRGPGVDEATDVEFVGRTTWTVTFTDAVYTYQCDPHFDLMHGSFTVGNPPPGRLAASVGPGPRIALRRPSGARVTSLDTGRYVVSVNDRSRTDNFHLIGPGVNRRTGVAFRGKRTWSLQLKAGRYSYRSDAHPARRGGFVVR